MDDKLRRIAYLFTDRSIVAPEALRRLGIVGIPPWMIVAAMLLLGFVPVIIIMISFAFMNIWVFLGCNGAYALILFALLGRVIWVRARARIEFSLRYEQENPQPESLHAGVDD